MKKITIEKLLTWAFVHELPKIGAGGGGSVVAGSSWNAIVEIAALGTMIDRSPNAYGTIPSYIYEGEPASDAVLVGDAVRALASREGFEIAHGWNPFPEWQDPYGLIRAEVDRIAEEQRSRSDRLNGRHVVNLVISAAMLGRGPSWDASEPVARPMLDVNGRAMWFIDRKAKDRLGRVYTYTDNGFDQRRHRPVKGAYRKWKLDRSLRGDILSRLDWQLWQDALVALHMELKNNLESHSLSTFFPARRPWIGCNQSRFPPSPNP
ncbi:hypothetical protein [Mycoplana rhizolycopersici]|uniref:Uncharacterized protein n=1 Tax=Mycoplana rhizolycopersici TaxID=2746702 RepID=A0ABX2Q9S2_9HYPH|nr:hypothetical protein [Rhizobium rhizolycopersici]NVP54474.1 hypothetical protein [Rhizobium rhizolycopersici]